MEERLLGKTGIKVSRIGLGCATFGREIDEAMAFQIMDYALEKGITLFDTAESYGGGQARECRRRVFQLEEIREVSGEFHSSEKIIGRWLKARGCRNQIVLETKVQTNFTRAHIAEALDESLQRLQTDTIDSYLFHSFDSNTPLNEGLEAMSLAIRAGKIRAAGCSNFTLDQLLLALNLGERHGLPRMEAIQSHYNLVARDIEKDILPFCQEKEIAVVGYSPLGGGFLAGKYTPDQRKIPNGCRFDVIPAFREIYFNERNFRVVAALRGLSDKTGVPMVRLAMGWTLRNRDLTSALVGARTTAHLENALIAEGMEFPDEWTNEMNSWN